MASSSRGSHRSRRPSTSDRIQRQIDHLLDEAEAAIAGAGWPAVKAAAEKALILDPDNRDARALFAAALRGLGERPAQQAEAMAAAQVAASPEQPGRSPTEQPTSFDNGRYRVLRFLGEGGKKKVYLAHDTLLDRDVAFALIKTEGLDAAGRQRITQEAQAMGRLGSHPHIVSVFDLGEEPLPGTADGGRVIGAGEGTFPEPVEGPGSSAGTAVPSPSMGEGKGEGDPRPIQPANPAAAGQPYMVTELMAGGDVEGAIESAPDHKLPLERAIDIAIQTCRGLEYAHSKGVIHRDLKPGNVWLTAPLLQAGASFPPPLGEGKGEGDPRPTEPAVPIVGAELAPPGGGGTTQPFMVTEPSRRERWQVVGF